MDLAAGSEVLAVEAIDDALMILQDFIADLAGKVAEAVDFLIFAGRYLKLIDDDGDAVAEVRGSWYKSRVDKDQALAEDDFRTARPFDEEPQCRDLKDGIEWFSGRAATRQCRAEGGDFEELEGADPDMGVDRVLGDARVEVIGGGGAACLGERRAVFDSLHGEVQIRAISAGEGVGGDGKVKAAAEMSRGGFGSESLTEDG